jgi:hypothetical protein
MPLSEEEPMVDRADPTEGGALELARSAAPAPARRRTALAAVARPAGEVAGLLLVEVLRCPRARAAALGLARSLARWLAGRRPPASARAEVTTRRVTVVKDAGTSVLVHRVETALVVLPRNWPALGPQTIQTILLYPSGAVWTDGASNVSRLDPSGAYWVDAEHPSRNRKGRVNKPVPLGTRSSSGAVSFVVAARLLPRQRLKKDTGLAEVTR